MSFKKIEIKSKSVANQNNINRFIFFIKIIVLSILIYENISKLSHKNIKSYKVTNITEIHDYCSDCKYRLNNLDSKCLECSIDLLFKDLKIVSAEDTLDEIIKNNRSISRLGDGEYVIIFGGGNVYQEPNEELSKRLLEIISNNNTNENLLVGISFLFQKEKFDLYKESYIKYWNNFINKNKFKLLKILNLNKTYYSSEISRFYYRYKDKSHVPQYIAKLKQIWENRDILIVEGGLSRIGIRNDLFNKTKSIKRIICPAKSAFRVYNKILNSILKISKDHLVLIALGPTAAVLAYDLSNLGYQAIDFGHIDIQYELYLRNATKWIGIPYKIVVEYDQGRNRVENINDPEYINQIIEKINY